MFIEGKQIHIGWLGCGTPGSGYGESNTAILKALAASNVVVHGADNVACEVGVAYMPLDCEPLENLPQPVKVVYSMFEATRWPDAWVSAANCANEVWVPSKWCHDTLIASGCDRPIRVIPQGIDPEFYYPTHALLSNPKRPFIIGYAGAANGRKGVDLLFKGFAEEFTPRENVELHIRTSSYLSSQVPNDTRIKIIDGVLSGKQMRDFYLSCDLLVLPTRGEGFGLTALEAMACGTCVAVTDFGGCKDYLGEDTLRIASSIEPCPEYRDCHGYWAKPSMQSLRFCLRWAFENRAQAKEMGINAAKRVSEEWTWDHTAIGIEAALCQLDVNERIALTTERVVVWKGDPMKVTTRVGGFTRGTPRVITDEQIARLNPSDVHPSRFHITRRYMRSSAPTADNRRQPK
jgi:glycosyltransferase involved in cell wall biosynthesis